MAKTIVIDEAVVTRLHLFKDPQGPVRLFAEYQLMAGTQPVEAKHLDVTARLSAANRSALEALFTKVSADIAANELA
jgi:hypothetical protein